MSSWQAPPCSIPKMALSEASGGCSKALRGSDLRASVVRACVVAAIKHRLSAVFRVPSSDSLLAPGLPETSRRFCCFSLRLTAGALGLIVPGQDLGQAATRQAEIEGWLGSAGGPSKMSNFLD